VIPEDVSARVKVAEVVGTVEVAVPIVSHNS
jgi:hypothetical protein